MSGRPIRSARQALKVCNISWSPLFKNRTIHLFIDSCEKSTQSLCFQYYQIWICASFLRTICSILWWKDSRSSWKMDRSIGSRPWWNRYFKLGCQQVFRNYLSFHNFLVLGIFKYKLFSFSEQSIPRKYVWTPLSALSNKLWIDQHVKIVSNRSFCLPMDPSVTLMKLFKLQVKLSNHMSMKTERHFPTFTITEFSLWRSDLAHRNRYVGN